MIKRLPFEIPKNIFLNLNNSFLDEEGRSAILCAASEQHLLIAYAKTLHVILIESGKLIKRISGGYGNEYIASVNLCPPFICAGYSNGYFRMFNMSGELVEESLFHKSPLLHITLLSSCHNPCKENYRNKLMVFFEGGLFLFLCEDSKMFSVPHSSSSKVYPISSAGSLLNRDSFSNKISKKNFVSVGSDPMIMYVQHSSEPTEIVSTLTSLVKTSLTAALYTLTPLSRATRSHSTDNVEVNHLAKVFHISDPNRKIISSIRKNNLISACDNYGRVLVLDTNDGVIVRMLKGYRFGSLAFLSTKIEELSCLFLIIYIAKRGICEIFRMRHGEKVCSIKAPSNGFLVGNDSQCFIICPLDSSLHEILIPHNIILKKETPYMKNTSFLNSISNINCDGNEKEQLLKCFHVPDVSTAVKLKGLEMINSDISIEILLNCHHSLCDSFGLLNDGFYSILSEMSVDDVRLQVFFRTHLLEIYEKLGRSDIRSSDTSGYQYFIDAFDEKFFQTYSFRETSKSEISILGRFLSFNDFFNCFSIDEEKKIRCNVSVDLSHTFLENLNPLEMKEIITELRLDLETWVKILTKSLNALYPFDKSIVTSLRLIFVGFLSQNQQLAINQIHSAASSSDPYASIVISGLVLSVVKDKHSLFLNIFDCWCLNSILNTHYHLVDLGKNELFSIPFIIASHEVEHMDVSKIKSRYNSNVCSLIPIYKADILLNKWSETPYNEVSKCLEDGISEANKIGALSLYVWNRHLLPPFNSILNLLNRIRKFPRDSILLRHFATSQIIGGGLGIVSGCVKFLQECLRIHEFLYNLDKIEHIENPEIQHSKEWLNGTVQEIYSCLSYPESIQLDKVYVNHHIKIILIMIGMNYCSIRCAPSSFFSSTTHGLSLTKRATVDNDNFVQFIKSWFLSRPEIINDYFINKLAQYSNDSETVYTYYLHFILTKPIYSKCLTTNSIQSGWKINPDLLCELAIKSAKERCGYLCRVLKGPDVDLFLTLFGFFTEKGDFQETDLKPFKEEIKIVFEVLKSFENKCSIPKDFLKIFLKFLE